MTSGTPSPQPSPSEGERERPRRPTLLIPVLSLGGERGQGQRPWTGGAGVEPAGFAAAGRLCAAALAAGDRDAVRHPAGDRGGSGDSVAAEGRNRHRVEGGADRDAHRAGGAGRGADGGEGHGAVWAPVCVRVAGPADRVHDAESALSTRAEPFVWLSRPRAHRRVDVADDERRRAGAPLRVHGRVPVGADRAAAGRGGSGADAYRLAAGAAGPGDRTGNGGDGGRVCAAHPTAVPGGAGGVGGLERGGAGEPGRSAGGARLRAGGDAAVAVRAGEPGGDGPQRGGHAAVRDADAALHGRARAGAGGRAVVRRLEGDRGRGDDRHAGGVQLLSAVADDAGADAGHDHQQLCPGGGLRHAHLRGARRALRGAGGRGRGGAGPRARRAAVRGRGV